MAQKKIVRKKSNRTASKSAGKEQRSKYGLESLGPARGSAQEKSSRWSRYGLQARENLRLRQQGPEVPAGIFPPVGFEGGQNAATSPYSEARLYGTVQGFLSVINLEELNVFRRAKQLPPNLLRAHGFVRLATDNIKVLGDGELKTKLAIHAHAFSAAAKEKITKAGGRLKFW